MHFLKSSYLALGLVIFYSNFFSSNVLAQKYIEAVGNSRTETFFFIVKQASAYSVKRQHKDKTEICIVDSNGFCLEWHFRSPAERTEYHATQKGNTVHLSGRKGSKNFSHMVTLKNYPWIQSWEFGIRQMVASGRKEMHFSSIDPSNPDRIATFAVKYRGKSTIIMSQSKVTAHHITVALQGLPAAIFQADYWLRVGDLILLRSEMPQGPFAPVTKLELKE